ncbi:6-carboxytetrahydropterin synthase [Marinomonas sp. 15G1-11]|uniref:6-carboxy-5,6,7,8-tetrahydropterin synthase n=1 Tax=Marinomonas phaeophyticola TaxID=3004091 RepID=A0ABT4JPN1_9GAMM|nr:6-carboxytetrahydropterin synthase [Marinomonas sp. 15G1-11]MCZ2720340.1 6-carboxytetrahydropterin synthase [Marinomonas sp. 15G1-11]
MKLFVKNLTHVDFSYYDAHRGLIGESWHTDVILEEKLNNEGMACDFSIIKKIIQEWLDAHLDHTLAIPTNHPLVSLTKYDERTHIKFNGLNGHKFDCVAPHEAFALLPLDAITPTTVSRWVESQIAELLPAEFSSVSIHFYPEKADGVQYHYTHGLKMHDGNCQRIAHGHRSTIEIYKNGIRSSEREVDWASRWKDIYLGTKEDVIDVEEMDGHRFTQFSYVSNQGQFDLSINEKFVYLIDSDTTVERIADHIASVLAEENPGCEIEVHAFEGIGKGAIANKKMTEK